MSDSPRDDLADLARLLSAHLAWQRSLGVTELPRTGGLPDARTVGVAAVPAEAPEAPVVPVAAPTAPVTVPASAAAPAPVVTPPPPGVAPPAAVAVPAVVRPVILPMFPGAAREPMPVLHGPARVEALARLQQEVDACTRCRLATTRRNTVFARGNPAAALCFVGEGPGEQEDLQGLPFVGPAGQLLDKIITAMGMTPDEVYVANIVKCRPPNNRVPEADEMTACTPFLVRQLELVRPTVIVALGRTAVSFLLNTKASMGSLRGTWHEYQGIPVLPTWHPAYLLRQPDAKRDTWEDMKRVLERLGRTVPARGG